MFVCVDIDGNVNASKYFWNKHKNREIHTKNPLVSYGILEMSLHSLCECRTNMNK